MTANLKLSARFQVPICQPSGSWSVRSTLRRLGEAAGAAGGTRGILQKLCILGMLEGLRWLTVKMQP